ncbi:MAG: carboxypeptidase regulatory-like domain-containing protein [Prosthecobacter sp.]
MKTLPPLLAVLLCLTVSPLQALDGGVHGRVYGQDEKGDNLGPLAGARIELKSETGAAVATATTNTYGYYQIATLKPGAYRYKVEAAGFKVEDEQRGFAMPQDTREFVHDFLLSKEPKPGEPGPAQTQVIQPAVHGRVYGQNEKGEPIGPIPGAKIELLSGKGGTVVATATANSPGAYYEINNLPPADYAYRVSAAGFATEDAGRGFTVPKATLEYVHDFLLSKTPPKRYQCELAMLVVKRISTSTNGRKNDNDVRVPVPNARVVLQPTTNQQTPLQQPFVTDARGEHTARDLPEGGYTVAIDAPECEPFTGTLKLVCEATRNNDQVIFELQPCNELLHGYVRNMLNEGWGPSSQAKAACDRAYQRALKADDKNDGRVNYALALAQLSAGQYDAAQQNLATAIGKKHDDATWDRACETRLWMNLCLHQPAQAVKEIRSLLKNHYGTRPATPASKDTARVCGLALGMIKGPWKDMVSAGDAALLESELLSTLKGDLQAECAKGRDHVAAEHGKLRSAGDAAHTALMADVTARRNAEIARIVERQTILGRDVAALDREVQTLQATVNEFDQKYRVQVLGFTQQRQALGAQIAPLNARLQQISACMAQDQQEYQAALQQQQMQQQQQQQISPTTGQPMQPGMRPGMMPPQGGMGAQAILAEMQQHQAEIQQIQAQTGVIQRQDAQMAAQVANLQNQFSASAGAAQANLAAKLRQREGMANEFENLDRQRTAPFDPASFTTPEIDNLRRQERALKTYSDLPLDSRREELLDQFDCGAAKDPQRAAPAGRTPTSITEPAFPNSGARPASTRLPMPQQPAGRMPATSSLPPAPAVAPPGFQNIPPAMPVPATPAPTPVPGTTPAFVPEPAGGRPMPPGAASELGLPPTSTSRRALPGTTTAPRPAANVGDTAEVIVSNNYPGPVRVFGIAPGSDNEMLVRSMQPGEEAMIPSAVGTTYIIRQAKGGQEVQRHKVGKKLEILKLGGPGARQE